MRPIEVALRRCVKLLAVFCAVALTFSVRAAAPEISSPLSVTAPINGAFSYTITATNGPNTFGAVGLPGTLSLNTSTGVISGTPTATANLSITITANNGSGTDTQTLTLNIYDPTVGGAPVISSATAFSMVVNTVAANVYQVAASNTPTSFGATGLPSGLSINTSNGIISVALSTAPVGQYTINVSATNASGTGSMPVIVVVNPTNLGPTITNTTPIQITGGSGQPPTISAVGATGFNATGLPAGITVNTGSGVFSGTNPGTEWDIATYFATDGSGNTGVKTIVIQVTPFENPPPVTSGGPPVGMVGQPYSYQMTGSGSGLTFNCVGLLNGLTMNTTSGLISGIPTAAGQFSVTLRASLIGGRSSQTDGTKSATIIINPAPPTITSATIVSGTVGTALSYQIIAAGATSFGATNLPPGLSINATGLISGTPTMLGGFTVNVTASKAGLTGNQNVAFNIGGNGANPIITSALTATGGRGSPFTYKITATGAGPITFAATGLPSGLTFATDTISGTPSGTGSFSVTLTATNFAGTSTQFLLIAIPGGAGDTPAAFLSPASASPNPVPPVPRLLSVPPLRIPTATRSATRGILATDCSEPARARPTLTRPPASTRSS